MNSSPLSVPTVPDAPFLSISMEAFSLLNAETTVNSLAWSSSDCCAPLRLDSSPPSIGLTSMLRSISTVLSSAQGLGIAPAAGASANAGRMPRDIISAISTAKNLL